MIKKLTIIIISFALTYSVFGQSELENLIEKCQKSAQVEENKRILEMSLYSSGDEKAIIEDLNLVLNDVIIDSTDKNVYHVVGTYIVNIIIKYPYQSDYQISDQHIASSSNFKATAKKILGDFVISEFKIISDKK